MVFTKFALASLALVALSSATVDAAPRVHPNLHRALRTQGTVNIMITLKNGVDAPISAVHEAAFASRGQKIAALVASLTSHAKTSQKSVDVVLAQESAGASTYASHQTFWISNQKVIKGASIELVEKLASNDDILEIREELVLPVPKVQFASSNATTAGRRLATNEYGVTKIGAPTVWAGGNTATGIVVGTIDTGVRYTHQALKGNWRSSYGWFDPTASKSTPYDDQGHGTHTMGTIAGQNGIGVAPGATWITCRACTTDGCSESNLLSCAQFMACPTDTAGNNKDCSQAPSIVSNSWGGGQGDTFFASAVSSWQAAGIIPVFANGNDGPACSTANSPGDYTNVIAVGATDSNDALASFSSKGPSTSGTLKPDVSAPGYNVRSAWYTSDSAYNTISGTSMATPHVAGAVALLLNAQPGLTFDQVKKAVTSGVDTTTLAQTGYTCGSTRDGVYPNNMYGYGRINTVKINAANV